MELIINRRFNEKELPDMKSLLAEGHKQAEQVSIPETLFMKTHGVRSEAEYKRKMMAQHKVMTHSHIGWSDVQYTAKAFHEVYDALHAVGYTIDRFGVCLDGSMGVPEKYRDRVIVGSGQIYRTPEEDPAQRSACGGAHGRPHDRLAELHRECPQRAERRRDHHRQHLSLFQL